MISSNKKHLLLLLILTTKSYASSTIDNTAKLTIGILEKNNNVRSCNHSLATCAITVSEPEASCLPESGSITISNSSNIIAQNIQPSSSDINYNTFVTVDNSCPASLLPNNSCTISFNTNAPSTFTVANILVKGTNTSSTFFDMNAIQCPSLATLQATPLNFTLVITGAGGIPVTVNITNSGNAPAIGITGTSPDPTINVQNNCTLPLAPGDNCNFVYTASITTGNGPYNSIISATNSSNTQNLAISIVNVT